ncbi:fimbrillin family protein [Parabacteroides bouchesdurhonensis]|uniref:fimbrillin family protein n=1 Tax=Parabacteroides bouchesdurhonensis TaxID=1936995 RepID=UPI000C81CF25|nr:fimbrillin family protein [Parabacteroides bouchesdurhonensis]
MKQSIRIITALLLWGSMSCSDGGDNTPHPVPVRDVSLEGGIGASTRAVINSGYKSDLDVCFARQDETGLEAGTYGMWTFLEATRTGGSGNRPILFTIPQLYKDNGGNTRLQGFYPAAGEDVTKDAFGGTVTFTVDGATDIMATPLLTGNTYSPVTTCTFQHLLTQLQFVCYSDKAADKWGSVVKIEITGVHATQRLALATEALALADVSAVGDEKTLTVNDFSDVPIETVADMDTQGLPDAQGYVLLPVLPVNGTKESPLHLQITTTKDGEGNVQETVSKVSLSIDGGVKAGVKHVISLCFSEGNRIEAVSVGVKEWADQEQGEIPV